MYWRVQLKDNVRRACHFMDINRVVFINDGRGRTNGAGLQIVILISTSAKGWIRNTGIRKLLKTTHASGLLLTHSLGPSTPRALSL